MELIRRALLKSLEPRIGHVTGIEKTDDWSYSTQDGLITSYTRLAAKIYISTTIKLNELDFRRSS